MNHTWLSQTHVGTVADTNWLIHGLGDQTGDGKADLLWRHQTNGDVWVWLMGGATIRSATWVETVPDVGYQVVSPR